VYTSLLIGIQERGISNHTLIWTTKGPRLITAINEV